MRISCGPTLVVGLFLLVVGFYCPKPALADFFVLEKIVDTRTPVPGRAVDFHSFEFVIPLTDGDVAFIGTSSLGPAERGIHKVINGSVFKVADFDTSIPEGIGTFVGFDDFVSLGNGNVGFVGKGTDGQEGIYKERDGGLEKVADLETLVPDGTGNTFSNFDFYEMISLGSGNLAFRASSGSQSQQIGIYTSINATLAKVADRSTSVPEGSDHEPFAGTIGPPVLLTDGNLAFWGVGAGASTGRGI